MTQPQLPDQAAECDTRLAAACAAALATLPPGLTFDKMTTGPMRFHLSAAETAPGVKFSISRGPADAGGMFVWSVMAGRRTIVQMHGFNAALRELAGALYGYGPSQVWPVVTVAMADGKPEWNEVVHAEEAAAAEHYAAAQTVAALGELSGG